MKFLNENTIKLSKDIKDGPQDENEKAPPESGKLAIFRSDEGKEKFLSELH